jgi:hypothetical protein
MVLLAVAVIVYLGILLLKMTLEENAKTHLKIAQRSTEEIVSALRDMKQILSEIRDVEFELEENKIRNTRFIPHKKWDTGTDENPLAHLKNKESAIKANKE